LRRLGVSISIIWQEGLTTHEHSDHQQAHQAALGVVHVKAVPQPLLRLATDLTIAPFAPARGNEVRREMVAEVLANGGTLGQHDGLGERWSSDGHQRRFAERVDFLELRRCELAGQALVDFYGVRGVFGAFFEEPDDALGAGFFEPGVLLDEILSCPQRASS
jgi:hypothetical protein